MNEIYKPKSFYDIKAHLPEFYNHWEKVINTFINLETEYHKHTNYRTKICLCNFCVIFESTVKYWYPDYFEDEVNNGVANNACKKHPNRALLPSENYKKCVECLINNGVSNNE